MAKHGILHDYDLLANAEMSAQKQTCLVCGTSPMQFQWSDYHGEGMCRACGCPYQLKAGSDEMKQEGAYPYCVLSEPWIPVVREYWEETGSWTYLGIGLGKLPGLAQFDTWAREHHPELYAENK